MTECKKVWKKASVEKLQKSNLARDQNELSSLGLIVLIVTNSDCDWAFFPREGGLKKLF